MEQNFPVKYIGVDVVCRTYYSDRGMMGGIWEYHWMDDVCKDIMQ